MEAPATIAIPFESLLSSSLPSEQHMRTNKRRHATATATDTQHLSASIPLPKSHIHRTRSELQLADDMLRAEYEDVRMYARLVVGMQSQCMVSGYVHPLTKKSLQDILKTKQADDETLKKFDNQIEEDGEWGLSYTPEDLDENSVDTPLPAHPLGIAVGRPTIVKTPSNGSLMSNLSRPNSTENLSHDDPQEDEDECVFSLEL